MGVPTETVTLHYLYGFEPFFVENLCNREFLNFKKTYRSTSLNLGLSNIELTLNQIFIQIKDIQSMGHNNENCLLAASGKSKEFL
ncbi:hypothetical protein LEP1GSC193_2778 [Leptospira alstonii serovar Pingchang str. 80-412]|uniref:Uncharacterized protein n=2 Tax=Leptospira alstonii TaxID=28452 RepID=M6CH98_9LEPT|nr:hypothetical protein LEP1GSC194_1013 [Leptospira alstonii serovar Sichuan str. 79601]EQA79292.1 hypothetical protein LEP1GSC193_2778 [Leptospira alstonii serovar Pingchang str. 80-412]